MTDSPEDRAIAEDERAIELNPNHATVHHWFGCGPLSDSLLGNMVVSARRSRHLQASLHLLELSSPAIGQRKNKLVTGT